jgi:hypothetical protein
MTKWGDHLVGNCIGGSKPSTGDAVVELDVLFFFDFRICLRQIFFPSSLLYEDKSYRYSNAVKEKIRMVLECRFRVSQREGTSLSCLTSEKKIYKTVGT